MKRRIYLSLLAMGMACIIITIIAYSWIFWRGAQEQARTELSTAVTLVAAGMDQEPDAPAYLQHISQQARGAVRITWIGTDGTILYESDYDAARMENHMQRPEVQQAFDGGNGTAMRESKTIARTLYYAAKKLPDGTVLRVSAERDSLYSQFLALLPIAAALFLLMAFGCFKTSRILTASLLAPLKKAAQFMEKIGQPDQALPTNLPNTYSELRPLMQKILEQSRYIDHTIQTLEQERNTIRLMMENLEEGVLLTGKDRKVLVANRGARDMLQLSQEQLVPGRRMEDLLPEADWAYILQQWGSYPVEEKQTLAREDRLYRMTVQSIYKGEDWYGGLFILYDITESEQREQLRREFTSNVSHELKTPLTSISGFAEMLATGLYQGKDDVAHFGQLIRKEAQRLLGLIDGIIHLTRIEEAQQHQGDERVLLKEMVENLVSFMEPVIQEKQITIHMNMTAVQVRGSNAMLREMAMNLIDNAVKYNRPGGHVYISLMKDKGNALFSVRDTGIGIPEEKQKRVFERFYRVDVSRSKQNGGSGLGLSIVKHIVEQHRGHIALKSREQEGTEITVTLPI